MLVTRAHFARKDIHTFSASRLSIALREKAKKEKKIPTVLQTTFFFSFFG